MAWQSDLVIPVACECRQRILTVAGLFPLVAGIDSQRCIRSMQASTNSTYAAGELGLARPSSVTDHVALARVSLVLSGCSGCRSSDQHSKLLMDCDLMPYIASWKLFSRVTLDILEQP